MTVRPAVEDDSERIREVARQSFQTSYSLSPGEIDTIIETEFGDEHIERCIEEDDMRLFVAEDDDLVVGMAETRINDDGDGELLWLHVDPGARGQGIGTELFEQATAQLRERTAEHVHALVMAQNEEGNQFFERWDFERGETEQHDIGDQTYRLEVFTNTPEEFDDEDMSGGEQPDEEAVPEDGKLDVDGETRYVDVDEDIPGEDGQFFVVYEDEASEDRYGFYCSNCGTFTSSVDGQGKIVCEECGNVHRPEEWDASYL